MMKKIFLTSRGLDSPESQKELIKLLENPIKKTRVLFIHGAKNKQEKFYVNESKDELINLGLDEENITDKNVNDKFLLSSEKFDLIYFCGGNTFYLLDRIKKSGFFSFIRKSVEGGAIFIGVSAGSIIAGKNIEIAGWGSEGDENSIKLKNLSGLELTDIAIFPHYRNELKNEVEEFRARVDYPVIELYDGEAILILGGNFRKIGDKDGS